ncbi:MAG TPA: ABC transporter substrate-binding protein [Micromonosporaceae bacterium]|nr:ABC transporter substrate-binding protein [Micromonosporaceae bacterium]
MRPRLAIAAAGAVAIIVSMGACSRTEESGGNQEQRETQTSGISTDPADSKGPAAEVEGARKGGTAYILRRTNYAHLDPQRTYSVSAMAIQQLFARTLTAFKEPGGNRLLLVGDLAEDTGKDVNKDCKVWEYKIKQGVKWEDGTAVDAKQIAYGIARSFDPDLTGGPTYLQEWLANDPQFPKVWDFKKNKTSLPPGLTTPDDYTLRFEFQKPQCELPYALALPTASPVLPAKDTGVDYDNMPFSNGPYKITKFQRGTEMILERNTNWDPATDPIRHQYPDKFHVKFGIDAATASNRVKSEVGDDKNAIITALDPALVPVVASDASLQNRVIKESTSFVWYLWINTQKVKDVNVRKALNWAVDRDAYIKSIGGDLLGEPVTTILSPLTIGYEKYDAYPGGPTGDPNKAKELLGGQTPALTLAHSDTPQAQQSAVAMKTGLERAGFKITLAPTPGDTFLDDIGVKNNPWDIYVSAWAADWPTARTTIPVLWDGRTIRDKGNHNYMYWNEPSMNSEMDRISVISDPKQAAKEWMALDKKIMTDFAPCVPIYADRVFLLHGSNVGGLYVSDSIATLSFTNVFVKS